MSKTRSKRILAVTAIMLVVILLSGIWAWLRQSPGSQLRSEIARMRCLRRPVSIQELQVSKIPDAQNGVAVYRRVFEAMSRLGKARDDEFFGSLVTHRGPNADPQLWSEARRASERYRGVIPLVERAAAMPRCRFWSADRTGLLDTGSYRTDLRRLNRLLLADALLEAKDGRTDRAMRLVGLSLRVCESLREEPMLMSYLVRVDMLHSACGTLRDVAEGNQSRDRLRSLYGALSQVELRPGLILALEGETANGIAFYNRTRPRPSPVKGFLMRTIDVLRQRQPAVDELYYLRVMNAGIDAAQIPYRDPRRRDVAMPGRPWGVMSADVVIPVFGDAWRKCDECGAEIAGSQVLLALKEYKGKVGTYPSSLGECRSRLGLRLPDDPFTGREFVYRPQESGFLLYSFGPDLKDDGGTPPRSTHAPASGFDIVWKAVR